MSVYRQTETRDLLSIGKSALQKVSGFIHLALCPIVIVPAIDVDKIDKVTKKIPNLGNTLQNDEAHLWKPGDELTPEYKFARVAVDFEYKGYSTKIIPHGAVKASDMTAKAFRAKRFGDVTQDAKILTRAALTVREMQLYAHLSSTTLFGAAETFSNGPLSTPAANQDPVGEVLDYITNNMNPIRQLEGFELHAVINPAALSTFRKHPAFSGKAVYSGSPGHDVTGNEAVFKIMREMWGVDHIHVMQQIKRSGRAGAAESIGYITGASGFFGLYLIKPGTVDYSTERDDASDGYPDGAIVMNTPRSATLDSALREAGLTPGALSGLALDTFIDQATMVEKVRLLYGVGYTVPRATAGGCDLGQFWSGITA